MIEAVLYSRLRDFAGLAALVGDRIYPIVLPQKCPLPAITYKRITTPPREPMLSRDTGTAQPFFEVTVFVDYAPSEAPTNATYDQLLAVAEQVRLALQRWQDADAEVDDTYIEDEADDFNPEALCFYRVLTVQIVHQEEIS